MLPVCEEIAFSSCIKREVCQLTLFDEQELKWKLDEDFKDDVNLAGGDPNQSLTKPSPHLVPARTSPGSGMSSPR